MQLLNSFKIVKGGVAIRICDFKSRILIATRFWHYFLKSRILIATRFWHFFTYISGPKMALFFKSWVLIARPLEPNWPVGPVHQDQTGPKYGSEYTTFFTVVLSTAYYLPLKTRNSKLEIETRHRNSKLKLDIEIRNGNSKLKLRLEIKTQAVWS